MSENYPDSVLQPMRQLADPPADAAIASLLGDRSSQGQHIFNLLIRNNSPIPDDLPQPLKDYFRQTEGLPDWADKQLLREGEQVFNAVGPEIVMLLFCKSLPLAYACGDGAQVLLSTGRMTNSRQNDPSFDNLNRRIMETAQFIMNVMAPGAMSGHGKGVVSAQKIRLIHASIRYFLHQADWDTATLGEPINQEDLAGTLMSFSSSIIDGLAQINMPLSERQAQAYLHLWRVVGCIMGVHESLLPTNVSTARELTSRILQRQVRPSEAGRQLTDSLINYMAYMMPGSLFDGFPADMIRYLVGDDMADQLGVEADNGMLDDVMLFMLKRILGHADFILDHSDALNTISRIVSRRLLQGLIFSYNDFKKVSFSIPSSLQSSWRVL
ncbi:MAG: DUF2236 domain-containing protein [gamma proteobacterium symbiont of Bathyaustriella thionipta]|nr:DUF2236 domain-containing protein [gamma proteobacterium symbiont of Bathyaustriella thionipta]